MHGVSQNSRGSTSNIAYIVAAEFLRLFDKLERIYIEKVIFLAVSPHSSFCSCFPGSCQPANILCITPCKSLQLSNFKCHKYHIFSQKWRRKSWYQMTKSFTNCYYHNIAMLVRATTKDRNYYFIIQYKSSIVWSPWSSL